MAEQPKDEVALENNKGESSWSAAANTAAAAASVAVLGTQLVVHFVGFLPTGIKAGSLAAKLMSIFAISNGGGIAKGSVVAILQSIGAVGLPAAAVIAIGVGVGVTAVAYYHIPNGKEGTKYRKRYNQHPELAKYLDFASHLVSENKFPEARDTIEQAHAELQKATKADATNEEAIPLLRAATDLWEILYQTSQGLGHLSEAKERRVEFQVLKFILDCLSPPVAKGDDQRSKANNAYVLSRL